MHILKFPELISQNQARYKAVLLTVYLNGSNTQKGIFLIININFIVFNIYNKLRLIKLFRRDNNAKKICRGFKELPGEKR